MRKSFFGVVVGALVTAAASASLAQYPQQPQPYPQQPQPQPYPQQYPPQQPQPYPQQPQPYPQQPQPYPQQPQPYPQQYPQQPYPQQYPQPYPQQYPQPQPRSDKRGASEMGFLYGTSIAYGVGTGIWVDAIAKISDPGIAVIAPLAFGAAVPVGMYFWDDYDTFHRGVASSIATGLLLGGVEGIAISGLQWQMTGNGGPKTWGFSTQTTVTFLTATGGGVGGYFFGEWLRPDPRKLSFIASGSAWGAIVGTLFGAGITPRRQAGPPNAADRCDQTVRDGCDADWKDTAAVTGFIGYNAGIAATGAVAAFYTPSYELQKYMWLGFGGGTAAASVVYIFYAASDSPPWHGLIANAAGGLAGIGLASILAANVSDDSPAPATPGAPPRAFVPPVNLGFSPSRGGGVLTASGMW